MADPNSDSEHNSDSDSDTNQVEDPKAPDVIQSIYKSMSQIIEALNTDNAMLNQQVNKIRGDLEFVCNTLATLKLDTQEMSSTCNVRSDDLVELKKKISAIGDLQKHVVETRNMLIQTLDANIKTIKKELIELRSNRDNIRPYIKTIVEEEVKQYLSGLPTLEKRFEALEREQRTILANHIRKSTVQSRIDGISQLIRDELDKNPIADVNQLREEQRVFIEKIEAYVTQIKAKLEPHSQV